MGSVLMETMALERLIELVEESVGEAGVHVSDSLLGTTSTTRLHESARVARESTTNTDQFRNQDISRVEDVIVVELVFELQPHQQREARNAAYVTSRNVRNKITRLANPRMRHNGETHLDTDEVVEDGWLIITDRYRFRRYEQVGRG